jgi:hypothetical protein
MTRLLALISLVALAGVLLGCGATPEPTEPPPTQTPWIVVVTATPGPERVADLQPTQTPWIVVATPTRGSQATATSTTTAGETENPTSTPEAVQTTSTAPSPTSTRAESAPAELKYPAPALLEPPRDRPVSWKSTVLLKWSSVGNLASDEYYHLHLERRPDAEGQDWYGDYVYTKDTQFLAEVAFLAPFHPPHEYGQGTVYWWVRVVRKTGEDRNGKPLGVNIGEFSGEWTLILDPKPEGE